MEIRNATRFTPLPMECGMRIAQIIVHQLDQPSVRPYRGRYQGARGAERAKLAAGVDVSAR
jgi:deoxycytidine triphosphate deaminase